jgi:putative membrane protein
MLVFRNQTSYNRFWDDRNSFQNLTTSVRNLVRTILTNIHNIRGPLTREEKEDINRMTCILFAIPYAVKNHLRCEWRASWALEDSVGKKAAADWESKSYNLAYASLLPVGFESNEEDGS